MALGVEVCDGVILVKLAGGGMASDNRRDGGLLLVGGEVMHLYEIHI